jgi:hypothetical protein
MLNLDQCAAICGKVRDRFKGGAKSVNKKYAPIEKDLTGAELNEELQRRTMGSKNYDAKYAGLQPDTLGSVLEKKYAIRDVNQGRAYEILKRHQGETSELGDSSAASMVRQMNEAAGNCMEMAQLAALWAFEEDKMGPARGRCFLVRFERPADHCFCLITEKTVHDANYASLHHLAAELKDAIAIDPWLNVTCRLSAYTVNSNSKLDAWQAAGKRVARPQEDGSVAWVDPGKGYKTQFIEAKVSMTKFKPLSLE